MFKGEASGDGCKCSIHNSSKGCLGKGFSPLKKVLFSTVIFGVVFDFKIGLFAQRALLFCVLIRCNLHTISVQEATAGGRRSVWGRVDVTCLRCRNTDEQICCTVCKQTHSLISGEVPGSREHTQIYHPFPYRQPPLKGNGLEGDIEQFLTPCLSHHKYTVCVHVHVCVWTATHRGMFSLIFQLHCATQTRCRLREQDQWQIFMFIRQQSSEELWSQLLLLLDDYLKE